MSSNLKRIPSSATVLVALCGYFTGGLASIADELGGLKHTPIGQLIQRYCVECHNPDKNKGEIDLQSMILHGHEGSPGFWDDLSWILEEREMPPVDEVDLPRPSDAEYIAAIQSIKDRQESGHPEFVSGEALPGLPVLDAYCTSCHSGQDAQSGLDLAQLISTPLHQSPEKWEAIVRKMNARQMPPYGKRWPDPESYQLTIDYLEASLDYFASVNPNPGRTSTFRRLTRTEYRNAVRDLFGLEVDVAELLPRDEVSHGFDNITVTELTPTLLDRYISSARMIAGLAVGAPVVYPEGKTVRIKTDISQTGRMDGLPLGTRGGVMIPYNFPRAGTYDIEITLTRDRNESVEGLHEPHDLEVLLNRELVKTFTVVPPVKGKTYHKDVDKHLRLRTHVESGRQEIGVTFVRKPDLLLERIREPFESSFNYHRHPRTSPAVFQVSITGPFEDAGVGDSESRRRIFGRYLDVDVKTDQQARQIIQKLARKAYRRPVNEGDITPLMAFFDAGKETGGFDAGIEAALSAILVNPNFIFRIEHDPAGMESGTPYEVNQIEFASRLSFFLWGSLPDDELLSLAESGELRKPDVLESQVMRMLGDARSSSLTELFAGQWLYLRNIDSVIPDLRLFPDFDENLRKAMRRETELLFEHVMREDKSVLELISADYTFLNERIARHYSLPGIHGDRFRKVKLDESGSRGGILRHASILSVTSYANRTSPVIRGAWILENIIGAPPPPPPPDVPNLEDVVISEDMPLRERLAAHRENPSCAGCHELMDPIGFALEAFDAVGQVRYLENGIPVDASGRVADGSTFAGVADLEDYIVKYPENFVRTMTEKLLTYGLGRGIEYYDMPAIREIVRKSRENDYQFSSLVLGVIQSQPFQQRIVQ